MIAFIDESGTLPDIKDNFIVICGVVVEKQKEAENIFSKILKSLHNKKAKTKIKELKFYHAGQNTKIKFLENISKTNFKVFALIVDKKKRKIADTPENYGILLKNLIGDIISWNNKNMDLTFILDKHFQNNSSIEDLNKIIGNSFSIKHVDSQQNLLVNIADMVAGSILWKYRGKDKQFYDIIKENIVVEKIVSWPEIKRSEKSKKIT